MLRVTRGSFKTQTLTRIARDGFKTVAALARVRTNRWKPRVLANAATVESDFETTSREDTGRFRGESLLLTLRVSFETGSFQFPQRQWARLGVLLGVICFWGSDWTSVAFAQTGLQNKTTIEQIAFEEVSQSVGLDDVLETTGKARPWRYAHGAAWGDVDGDGRPDLYMGAFAGRKYYEGDDAPIPNWLFRNTLKGFRPDTDAILQARDGMSRCSGVLFADLDQDADLDLVVANHVQKSGQIGTQLFENLGAGRFRNVTPSEGDWPHELGTRNIAALDVNHDGWLDLIVADGSYGRDAANRAKLWVLQNRRGFRFQEVSEKLGLPQGQSLGLGLALGDVNHDGEPDIFVAGCNRLFVSRPNGGFGEIQNERFAQLPADAHEGMHCGAALGDLNRDGRLDLITTEHGVPTRLHLYRQQFRGNGTPEFIDVTKTAGLGGLFPKGTRQLPIKTAHVALRDIDNDGRPDIVLSVLWKTADGKLQPVVLRNLSERGGELKFTPPPLEQLTTYYAPGPMADYDRDGRVDLFLPSWFEEVPNRLFRNISPGGHWLTVRVVGQSPQRNTQGIGAVVRVYEAGHLGKLTHLIGRADITIGNGYASGEESLAHLGLGSAIQCDVDVAWQTKTETRTGVPADQLLSVIFAD